MRVFFVTVFKFEIFQLLSSIRGFLVFVFVFVSFRFFVFFCFVLFCFVFCCFFCFFFVFLFFCFLFLIVFTFYLIKAHSLPVVLSIYVLLHFFVTVWILFVLLSLNAHVPSQIVLLLALFLVFSFSSFGAMFDNKVNIFFCYYFSIYLFLFFYIY
jgi:hypothetical protein